MTRSHGVWMDEERMPENCFMGKLRARGIIEGRGRGGCRIWMRIYGLWGWEVGVRVQSIEEWRYIVRDFKDHAGL